MDRSTVLGVEKRLRHRSYVINGQLNPLEGYGDDLPFVVARKVTGIPVPGPSQLMVFIEPGERSIGWGDFGWANKDADIWVMLPSDRHGQSGSLSFGDGHAELRRWRWPKQNRPNGDTVKNKADLKDFKFMTLGRPRRQDYTPAWWSKFN